MYRRYSGLRSRTRQIIYHDTQPKRRFKKLHDHRGSLTGVRLGKHGTVFLSDMQLAGAVSPTKIPEPMQTGDKPFVNVNGRVALRVTQRKSLPPLPPFILF